MRRRTGMSPELKAAIELHNTANRLAKVESRKPMRVQREEANRVRKELMHESGMTKKQRRRAERIRQANLTFKRAHAERVKRVGELLAGMPASERKTDLGIVLPSGADIGAILSRVRE